jgi:hypothetical protein
MPRVAAVVSFARCGWLALALLFVPSSACKRERTTPPAASAPGPAMADVGAPPVAAPAADAGTEILRDDAPVVDVGALPSAAGRGVRRETIPEGHARRIVLNELKLMWMALDALEAKGWDGAWKDTLPISSGDLDAAELRRMVADEQRKERELTIPAKLEPLYVSPEAAQELQREVLAAREDYVALLRQMQVLPAYLDELDEVLPLDPARMIYHGENDPDAKPTRTEPVRDPQTMEQDYSRLALHVQAVDVWNGAQLCQSAQLLGPKPAEGEAQREWHRGCRDLAARMSVYHELTHALQHAYVNLHLPPGERNVRVSWNGASKLLMAAESGYFWRWGGVQSFADMDNHDMADERQADGVVYQVVVAAYDLSPVQAAAVWEFWFGRLEDARDLLLRIRDRFDRAWPGYPPSEFGGALFDVFGDLPLGDEQSVMRDLCLRLGGIAAYVGYLQPMRPEESGGFWRMLGEE